MKDEGMKVKGPIYDTTSNSHDKDAQEEANESTKTPPITVYHINGHTIDAAKERDFFLQRGAIIIISASIDERHNLPKSNHGRRFFDDGRPYTLCRISGCFTNHQAAKNHYLCIRHYKMIEGYTACDAIASKNSSNETNSEVTPMNPTAVEIYGCSHCNNCFNSFNEAAIHAKNSDCWSVEETTKIAGKCLLGSIFFNVFM